MATNTASVPTKLCPSCHKPMQLFSVRYNATGDKPIQYSWVCHCGPVLRYVNEHL